MVISGARVVLRPEQFFQRRILRRIGAQNQHHPRHVKIRCSLADRVLRLGQRVPLVWQHYSLIIVDRRDNSVRGVNGQ
jgi:hypothetical protein